MDLSRFLEANSTDESRSSEQFGSGKTTFARKTSKLLNAPHIELDALHWEPNWVEAPNDLFLERVKQSLQGDTWVVDGNYHQVRDIVWTRADTVVWLDYPFRTIMSRLARRTLRRIVTHEELWKGNQEHIRGLFNRDSVLLWAIRNLSKTTETVPHSSQPTRELSLDSRKVEITARGRRVSLQAQTRRDVEIEPD